MNINKKNVRVGTISIAILALLVIPSHSYEIPSGTIDVRSIHTQVVGVACLVNQTTNIAIQGQSCWSQWTTPNNMTIIAYKQSLSSSFNQTFEASTHTMVGDSTGLYQPFPIYERDIHSIQNGVGMDDIHWLNTPIFVHAGSTFNLGVYVTTVHKGAIMPSGAVELTYLIS